MNIKDQPRIRLTSEEKIQPRPTRIPTHRAIEWLPKNESGQSLVPNVKVFLTQKAYIRICAHAGSDLSNELGGWLAGKFCYDFENNTQFVVIDTILAAPFTNQGAAHLTFTSDSQVAMYEFLNHYYPEKELLGWYHTHPKMGIFFSSWDEWLHMNFFPHSWQIALVIEPVSSKGGFFIRQKNGNFDTREYFGFHELINDSKKSIVFWNNLNSTLPLEDDDVEVISI